MGIMVNADNLNLKKPSQSVKSVYHFLSVNSVKIYVNILMAGYDNQNSLLALIN